MKYFLNITLVLFVAILVFNFTNINYGTSLISDPNNKFLYSGITAAIGILVIFIVKQLRLLAKKN